MVSEDLEEKIYGNSTGDQKIAIDHIGSHARLLAGPGTGKTKTITRRVLSLILRHNIEPSSILLLTFTRLAAGQLREEIEKVINPLGKPTPKIATLHSFALRQILFNSSRVNTLPNPIRIADDWEERYIIQEDIKKILKVKDISDIQQLINRLSADWEKLNIEESGWEQNFPNPTFLAAWRQHKQVYGETLRAELVYQLKKQLNQNREFVFDQNYEHILIDEYQDLNACDLAVISELEKKKSELFVVGDDDQSIYGFRYANPTGIRQFPQLYTNTKRLNLEICFRCDKDILKYAEFVAEQDVARLSKITKAKDDAADGHVELINCENQKQEAEYIAKKIKVFIDKGEKPENIAILLRSDSNGALSKPLIDSINKKGINVSISSESELEYNSEYRMFISLLRLTHNGNDDLSLRTIMQEDKSNRIGEEAINAIWGYASSKAIRFHMALREILADPKIIIKHGDKIARYLSGIQCQLSALNNIHNIKELIEKIIELSVKNADIKDKINLFMQQIIVEQNIDNVGDLLKAMSSSSEMIEQEIKENSINLLTMHRAKGLTFNVCFIVGAEDEYIPGRNEGEKEGDERRLLYVSMTRAKHNLYITYCNKRTGSQKYSGRNSGNIYRNITRFLKDGRLKPTIL